MLWVGGGVAVLPLSVVLVTLLVRASPAELRVLALPVMPMVRALQVMPVWMVVFQRCCGVGTSPLLAQVLVGVAGRCVGPGGVCRAFGAPLGVVDADGVAGVVPGGVPVVAVVDSLGCCR